MKPNASLKSRNAKVLLMASRSLTSLQPASLASAALRASPANFCAIVLTPDCATILARLKVTSPLVMPSLHDYLINARPTRGFPMPWSLTLGSIAGTQVRVHITFLLFLGWIFAASWVSEGSQAAWSGLIFMVLLFACVLAHEFGHIFTARAFGVATPDVTLLPIGGVVRLERIPEKPYQEFLVAIAGPLVNVAIAFALVGFAGANLNANNLATVENMRISLIDRL